MTSGIIEHGKTDRQAGATGKPGVVVMTEKPKEPTVFQGRQLFDKLPEGLILIDQQGQITDWNHGAEQVLGWHRDDVVGRILHELILPPHFHLKGTDKPELLFTDSSQRLNARNLEILVLHASGDEIPVELSIFEIETGPESRFAVVVHDISVRKQNQFMLQMQQRILEMIATGKDVQTILDELCMLIELEVPQSVCTVMKPDESDKALYVMAGPSISDEMRAAFAGLQPGDNMASCGTAFHTRKEVIVTNTTTDERWKDFQPVVTKFNLHACWSLPIRSGSDILGTFAISLTRHAVPCAYEHSLLETASWLAGIALTHDINQQRIHKLAMCDDLTGLPNRKMLLNELSSTLEDTLRSKRAGAVMFLDLDNFKTINDTMGHRVGDELLRTITRRLTGLLDEKDIIARMGGDEFIVVQQESTPQKARHLAEQIRQAVSRPMDIDLLKIQVTTSIGIALFPDDAVTTTNLLKYADSAMYMAKESGRNTIQFYLPVMDNKAVSSTDMRDALTAALCENQLSSYVQPIVDARNNSFLGTEILMRWQHPARGLLDATEFLPLVDKLDLTRQYGKWVFKEAASLIANHSKTTPIDSEHRLSVNVTSEYFLMNEFDDDIRSATEEITCGLECMRLEITINSESAEHEKLTEKLRRYHSNGISLALDNIGSNHVSLYSQWLLPVDYIKLDVSLVRDIPLSYNSARIIDNLIDVAHTNRQKVIAVGVETSEQLDHLRKQGCDAYQGYLYCGPVCAEDLADTLQSWNADAQASGI